METLNLASQLAQELLIESKQSKLSLYAIIDSAVHEKLRHFIRKRFNKNDYSNLFNETDFSSIENAAPYLISVNADNTANFDKVWDLPWGIFLTTAVEQEEIEEHLRRNLFAQDPLGEELLFRYFDPRVLPTFLRSSNNEEQRRFFGPVSEIHIFDKEESELISFSQ